MTAPTPDPLGWTLEARSPDDPTDLPPTALDLALVAGPGGRDLARVSGARCLAQSLRIAFGTALGEQVLDPGFGFDGLRAFVEEADPDRQRDRIRLAIIRLLARDGRITRIHHVHLDQSAGQRTLRATVACDAAGQPLRLDLDTATAAGRSTP